MSKTATQAWSAVMEDVRAIAKGEKSGTGGGPKYDFRGIDTVMNAVGPALRTHGVVVVPTGVDAKHRDFADKNDKTVHEAILTVSYRVYGPEGDFFDGCSIGESADYSDKATTQAMSVAYRTFLLQALTMPTDEPDPDLSYVERADHDEATERGWASTEVAAAEWTRLGALTKELPNPDAIREWFRSEVVDFAHFTPDLARQWGERIGEAEITKPEPSPQGFDREGAWETLEDKKSKLPAKRQAEVEAWMAERGITPDTLTREQASEAWTEMEAAPTTVKEQGWKSKAERERTYDSLTERTEALEGEEGHEAIVTAIAEEAITRESLTKDQAGDWLMLVAAAEAARTS